MSISKHIHLNLNSMESHRLRASAKSLKEMIKKLDI